VGDVGGAPIHIKRSDWCPVPEVKASQHNGIDFFLILDNELEYFDEAVYYAWQILFRELMANWIQHAQKTLVTLRTICVDVGMKINLHSCAGSDQRVHHLLLEVFGVLEKNLNNGETETPWSPHL